MIRTLSLLSLLLASGIAVAAQTGTAPKEERPTMTVFGEVRPGGNAFNPVYTFQPIPQKRAVVRRDAVKKPEASRPAPTRNEGKGEVQEL